MNLTGGASPAALAGSPNLPQSIQKDPNRKSVGSPGVQSSPRKVYLGFTLVMDRVLPKNTSFQVRLKANLYYFLSQS